MFKNKSFEGIYYSRFIASYNNMKGNDRYFKQWLSQLVINDKHIPEDVIYEICNLAFNGKLELENNAAKFLEEKGL